MNRLNYNLLNEQADNVINYINALCNTSSSSIDDLLAKVNERITVELNLLSSNDPYRNK